jgi:hypothetical protein
VEYGWSPVQSGATCIAARFSKDSRWLTFLMDDNRGDLVTKLVSFACEAAEILWHVYMLDRDSAGEH